MLAKNVCLYLRMQTTTKYGSGLCAALKSCSHRKVQHACNEDDGAWANANANVYHVDL